MGKRINEFDVLVVYTDGIAVSASAKFGTPNTPFPENSARGNYNDAYAYLLELCERKNLKAAFTTTKDLTSNRNFNSHWRYANNKWIKVNEPCTAPVVFDKFAPINDKQKIRREFLFSDESISPFNDPEVLHLFFDKQKTYETFSSFSIPTVSLNTIEGREIEKAYQALLAILDEHPNKHDFSIEFILKDRYGAGGNNIHRIETDNIVENIRAILLNYPKHRFVLQPFMHFNEGFGDGKFRGYTDIRLVYLGDDLIQVYIRKPKKDDYRCNEHQGGSLEYLLNEDVPRIVMKKANKVLGEMPEKKSLFALDFIISNSGNVYLMEGNSGPGIDWKLSNRENEKQAKKLIGRIVKELGLRSTKYSTTSYPLTKDNLELGVSLI